MATLVNITDKLVDGKNVDGDVNTYGTPPDEVSATYFGRKANNIEDVSNTGIIGSALRSSDGNHGFTFDRPVNEINFKVGAANAVGEGGVSAPELYSFNINGEPYLIPPEELAAVGWQYMDPATNLPTTDPAIMALGVYGTDPNWDGDGDGLGYTNVLDITVDTSDFPEGITSFEMITVHNYAHARVLQVSVDTDPFVPGPIPCFVAGTKIRTDQGDVLIEDLNVGDKVLTMDNGYQAVLWIGRRSIGSCELKANPNLRPVRISSGALGEGLPENDLIVSPQHRILSNSKITKRMFENEAALIAAKKLVPLDGIDFIDDADKVEYFHFLCSRHEIVFAEGAATETLYAGKEALKSLPKETVAEVFELFPELVEMDADTLAIPARQFSSGRKSINLVTRHVQNQKSLWTASV